MKNRFFKIHPAYFFLSFIFVMLSFAEQAHSQIRREHYLIMRNTGSIELWDKQKITVWGFTQRLTAQVTIPSPTLYAEEGDTVVIKVKNISQGDPHTIHLHGLDVDQANDGVPHTSFEVHHMEDTIYTFVAKHAGTYLYHCHVLSVVHVQMGMYGMIVVKAAKGKNTTWTGGPAYHREFAILTSEMDKSWHDNVPGGNKHSDTGMTHDTVTVPPYNPTYFLVNGKSQAQLRDTAAIFNAGMGETVYLRFANMGYTMNRIIFPSYLKARVVDSDGRPLPDPFDADTLRITTGERYGVLITAPATEKSDSIAVQYVDMNNRKVIATEYQQLKFSEITAIAEAKNYAEDVELFPNPASEQINFILPESNKDLTAITIYNASGKIISGSSYSGGTSGSNTVNISVKELPQGIYFAQIVSGNKVVRKKFIISR